MSEFEFLHLNIESGVARVTMDLPPLNVLNNSMMAEFNALLDQVCDNPEIAAIVIGGQGKAFSAGVDVGDHSADSVKEMIEQFHGIFRKLLQTDAVTVAAVQGAALGGGCEIACFCDIVLASERAKFGQPEVQVGVFPPVAAAILPLVVGVHKAIELNALGGIITAQEALGIGLVQQVYPTDEFEVAVNKYVEHIQQLSRPVVRMAKNATMLMARNSILEHIEKAEKMYLNELMQLSDSHEGIAAFMEKRKPAWSHA